jgi:GTPase
MEHLNQSLPLNNNYNTDNTSFAMLDDLSLIERELCSFQVNETTPRSKSYFVEYKLCKDDLLQESKMLYLKSKLEKAINLGNGVVYCLLGVNENGESIGLSKQEEYESSEVLDILCQELKLKHSIIKSLEGPKGRLLEIIVLSAKESSNSVTSKPEIRIGMFGDESAGKSTLIGVLVDGVLDDGNGLARSNIFRFQHEQYSGKTSNFSHYVS